MYMYVPTFYNDIVKYQITIPLFRTSFVELGNTNMYRNVPNIAHSQKFLLNNTKAGWLRGVISHRAKG